MIDVTGAAVAEYLGRGDEADLVALAGAHVPIVTEWVKAYTRGVGFYVDGQPADPVAAVIAVSYTHLTLPTIYSV